MKQITAIMFQDVVLVYIIIFFVYCRPIIYSNIQISSLRKITTCEILMLRVCVTYGNRYGRKILKFRYNKFVTAVQKFDLTLAKFGKELDHR
jgi:hypothetical protein